MGAHAAGTVRISPQPRVERKIGMIWKGQTTSADVRTEAPDLEIDVIHCDGRMDRWKESVWTNVGFLFVSEGSGQSRRGAEFLGSSPASAYWSVRSQKGIGISPMKDVVVADLVPVGRKVHLVSPEGRPGDQRHWPDLPAMGQDGGSVISESPVRRRAGRIRQLMDGASTASRATGPG